MALSKRKQIEKALLKVIPKGKALHLGEDVFLTGVLLDGSDKIYGFINDDGEILVKSRGGESSGWGFDSMDSEDIDYIYGMSAPNILKKIKQGKYKIVEPNEL